MNMTIERRKIGARGRPRARGLRRGLLGLACLAAATGAASAQMTEVVLHNFCSLANCADGETPYAGVIRDSDGNLYGTTVYGGANGGGVVYRVDTSRHETVLYSFCSLANCADGEEPCAGVIRDSEGNLYGATEYGGANGFGAVYKVDTSGNETVLYSFCSLANCADGERPMAGVIRDSDGNLYGTTYSGGANGGGAVYKVNTSGETVLHSFCSLANCADGQAPVAGVIRDSKGNLYGTTDYGGANGDGVVYKVDTSGSETVLYSFCSLADCADGPYPQAGVIRDSEGNLYGTTINSAVDGGDGVVYKVDSSGSETLLYNFCSLANCADGQGPTAGVIRDSEGNLYGTTESGGAHGYYGVVYKVDTSGSETVLYSFCPMASCADGRYPFAGVIRDKAGNLYGAASSGGRNDNAGVVFKLKP
jgi:uncharacterized repeat protein (TIGR03803 family)